MIPAIHSIRLAVSPSRNALMIGMPPATAPSNATITPFACAAAKISLPCRASSALLAVTTCLPLAIACRMNVRAGSMPPISSTTMSMSACASTTAASAVTIDAGRTAGQLARALDRALGDPGDPDRPPRAPRDLLLVAAQHGPQAGAHGADAEEAHFQRFHRLRHPSSTIRRRDAPHRPACTTSASRADSLPTPSSRNICLIPRIACRVRDSFSIIAKRT